MTALFDTRFVYSIPKGMPPREWHSDCQNEFNAKMGSHPGGQFVFNISAGVGSGKTYLAALLSAGLLNRGKIDRVVFVCPNRIISASVIAEFERFGICLSDWKNGRHVEEGEGAMTQGAVVTYQSLAMRSCYKAHLRIARKKRTLVIFDEIHHLGDKKDWGEAARAAFEWLRTHLSTGPRPVGNTRTLAEAQGFDSKLIYRARDTMKLTEDTAQGLKWWALPSSEEEIE